MGGNKFQHFRFTNFDEKWTFKQHENIRYIRSQTEKCPTSGKIHHQGYCQLFNAWSMKMIQKIIFKSKCHIGICNGSPQQNIDYCSKEESRVKDGYQVEWGAVCLTQGQRTDLNEIKDKLVEGKTTVDQILMESPITYHQYGRTLSKLEDLVMRKKFRKEMTLGLWIWGETGTGKSHEAFVDFNPDKCYNYPVNDRGWWDGYTQQDIVIINDFRGEISYNFLLQLVDKWPVSVPRRGREPMPFTSKQVIVTSSLPPNKVYKNRSVEDDIAQLLRRFVIKKAEKCSGGNTVPPELPTT